VEIASVVDFIIGFLSAIAVLFIAIWVDGWNNL